MTTIPLTQTALSVLERRYLRGQSPEVRFLQMCEHIAYAEKPKLRSYWIEQFYAMVSSLDFLPNSPTIMNAGRDLGQLSACFVIPVDDTMEGIFGAIRDMAIIQKSGGGTGFSFTRLRPRGSSVNSTSGIASGPVSFMRVFNAATEEIKQGGTRRGANMAILRVDHPDIMQFIECKSREGDLSNFNISVGLTEEFMRAVEDDSMYWLRWGGKLYAQVRAREVFDKIIHHSWLNGEPGVVFLDTINRFNPTPAVGEIESTNPCGEQPLLPWESCNLGSINLNNMVHNGDIDYQRLEHVTATAVRFLDDVIDVNKYPMTQIEQITKANRKIGLGVMGFADMLAQMSIPYDSDDGVAAGDAVSNFIQTVAWKTSCQLAEEKGSFPNIELSVYRGKKVRNATRTTIAPTGTLAMIAGVEYGIEPKMALAYTKTVMDNDTFVVVDKYFERALEHANLRPAAIDSIIQRVTATGSCQDIVEIPKYIRDVFKTGPEIDFMWHVRMQAAFQNNCDNAVSKTINFHETATEQDMASAVIAAYRMGCKGLTIYRRGSRVEEVIVAGSGRVDAPKTIEYPISRPKRLPGVTDLVETGCGKMCITVNMKDEQPIETIIVTGGEGGCHAMAEGMGKVISTALRYGTPREALVKKLMTVTCNNFIRRKSDNPKLVGKSCPDVIGRTLKDCMNDIQLVTACSACTIEKESEASSGPACPTCGHPMQFVEGCVTCPNCGDGRCKD